MNDNLNREMHLDTPFIRLQNLSKTYQEGQTTRRVLHDLSLDSAKGEFIAILGTSGSGKSTLLNLISGIDYPDSGNIWINGSDLTQLDENQRTRFRRRHIGFIFQFFNLIPTLTVLENILLPLELNQVPLDRAQQQSRDLLQAVGLEDRAGAFPDRLSGGEQQRVAIARALGHDPALVLADEPTGNLDEATGRQILNLLDRLTRQAGKNLILVTHNPESADYADRTLRMSEGQLEA